MRKSTLFILLFGITFTLFGCGSNNDESTVSSAPNKADSSEEIPEKDGELQEEVEIMVSAAVSLTDALEEIKVLYEKVNPVKLTFVLGGSGSLAQQIHQGAPVDVFISANQKWMDSVEEANLLKPATRQDITGNRIVLIAGKTTELGYTSIDQISADDIRQIAIGNPESVPAGKYTEQLLKSLHKWDDFENKLVLGKDVRQVLTYVETGNVDLGFVYESDALSSNKIKILAIANETTHDPAIYPGAVLADTKVDKEASAFLTYLTSDEAQEILMKHGFRK